jgi:SWI/SNF-related matrix-associated actin-dependent regulator 1 of chromatin subfamily A
VNTVQDLLYPYQRALVQTIMSRDHPSYLAAEMGLGKSLVAIEVAKAREDKRILILCPAVGRLVWVRELAKWWPGMPVFVIRSYRDVSLLKETRGVFIVAYSTVSVSNSSGFDIVATLRRYQFDMTVLDEAHALKNPGAIRTKAIVKTLKPCLGFVLPMSGTPAPNHAGELHPILHAFFPDAIMLNGHAMKRHEFEERYCQIENKFFNGRAINQIAGSKNITELRSRLKPYTIRVRKKDVLTDLPDMRFDVFPIDAPGAPQWRTDWHGLSESEFEAAFSDVAGPVSTMRRDLGLSKVPGAVEAITEALEDCSRKMLVFAHHREVVLGLMQGLAAYNPVAITGATGPIHRQEAINRFLLDPPCRVFVGNIQAAGTSITLVGPDADVSDVWFVESSFSPGDNYQAASRIHRIGQKNAVTVWFLHAAGTYDERVMDIVARKARDFARTFDQ